MNQPARIQLSREKGWRMPANTVKVDRSTKWGNPHRVGAHPEGNLTAQEAVDKFRLGFRDVARFGNNGSPIARMARDLDELRGKNLACWCPLDAPCHADVLLALANEQKEEVAHEVEP